MCVLTDVLVLHGDNNKTLDKEIEDFALLEEI